MTKFPYKHVIIISAVALLGIILLQVMGIYNSYTLKKKLSHEHVQLSLHTITTKVCRDSLLNNAYEMESEVKASLQDLFQQKIKNEDFQFAILNQDQNKILYSNCDIDIQLIKEFRHKEFGLCTSNQKDIFLYLDVAQKDKIVSSYIIIWVIFSFVMIAVLGYSFYYIVSRSTKQYKLSNIKNDFINNMSHELKTPIATMSVASEMLIRDEVISDKERSSRYAKIIRDESLRLRNLVDRVLNIAIFEKQQPDFIYEEVEMGALLETAIQAFEIIVEKREGKLTTDFSATDTVVSGDKAHLHQTITNLIDNAIKYSPEELEIRITTSNTKHYLCINVEDKGIGIDKKEKERIFEKFHRLSTGDVHDIKGFGIGLYYVKRIIEHHKGKLDVNSNGKKGSRFSLYIPTNNAI